ncbi:MULTISPECIES: hypothetical protein [Aerosakkonema]|uniref:hypothetical protein n=1 Tax=Aerosakkonema TaxID=1246629 RepID=UPI0035B80D01
MKKILLVAASLLVLLNSNPADACSCLSANPRRSYQQARAVFAGKVTDIVVRQRAVDRQPNNDNEADRLFTEVKVTFEVTKVWKGRISRQAVVMTSRSSASCGYNFEKGKEYLVYAANEDAELTTGLCSGTKPLAMAQADLSILRNAGTTRIENQTGERSQEDRGL